MDIAAADSAIYRDIDDKTGLVVGNGIVDTEYIGTGTFDAHHVGVVRVDQNRAAMNIGTDTVVQDVQVAHPGTGNIYLFVVMSGNRISHHNHTGGIVDPESRVAPPDRPGAGRVRSDLVVQNFIPAVAGGNNTAIDTVFAVPIPDGTIKITVPKLTMNYAKFSAIKNQAGDSLIAINCGGPEYTNKNGLVWKPYQQKAGLTPQILNRVLEGTPALLLPDGQEAVAAYGELLGKAGCFEYLGHVGNVRASWMGSWYFVHEHPVMNGLPVITAMKSYYQTPVSGSDGILIDGDNVEVFIGYGRDHDINIGAAGLTVPFGKGHIVFLYLPGISNLQAGTASPQPIIMHRLLANAMGFLIAQ